MSTARSSRSDVSRACRSLSWLLVVMCCFSCLGLLSPGMIAGMGRYKKNTNGHAAPRPRMMPHSPTHPKKVGAVEGGVDRGMPARMHDVRESAWPTAPASMDTYLVLPSSADTTEQEEATSSGVWREVRGLLAARRWHGPDEVVGVPPYVMALKYPQTTPAFAWHHSNRLCLPQALFSHYRNHSANTTGSPAASTPLLPSAFSMSSLNSSQPAAPVTGVKVSSLPLLWVAEVPMLMDEGLEEAAEAATATTASAEEGGGAGETHPDRGRRPPRWLGVVHRLRYGGASLPSPSYSANQRPHATPINASSSSSPLAYFAQMVVRLGTDSAGSGTPDPESPPQPLSKTLAALLTSRFTTKQLTDGDPKHPTLRRGDDNSPLRYRYDYRDMDTSHGHREEDKDDHDDHCGYYSCVNCAGSSITNGSTPPRVAPTRPPPPYRVFIIDAALPLPSVPVGPSGQRHQTPQEAEEKGKANKAKQVFFSWLATPPTGHTTPEGDRAKVGVEKQTPQPPPPPRRTSTSTPRRSTPRQPMPPRPSGAVPAATSVAVLMHGDPLRMRGTGAALSVHHHLVRGMGTDLHARRGEQGGRRVAADVLFAARMNLQEPPATSQNATAATLQDMVTTAAQTAAAALEPVCFGDSEISMGGALSPLSLSRGGRAVLGASRDVPALCRLIAVMTPPKAASKATKAAEIDAQALEDWTSDVLTREYRRSFNRAAPPWGPGPLQVNATMNASLGSLGTAAAASGPSATYRFAGRAAAALAIHHRKQSAFLGGGLVGVAGGTAAANIPRNHYYALYLLLHSERLRGALFAGPSPLSPPPLRYRHVVVLRSDTYVRIPFYPLALLEDSAARAILATDTGTETNTDDRGSGALPPLFEGEGGRDLYREALNSTRRALEGEKVEWEVCGGSNLGTPGKPPATSQRLAACAHLRRRHPPHQFVGYGNSTTRDGASDRAEGRQHPPNPRAGSTGKGPENDNTSSGAAGTGERSTSAAEQWAVVLAEFRGRSCYFPRTRMNWSGLSDFMWVCGRAGGIRSLHWPSVALEVLAAKDAAVAVPGVWEGGDYEGWDTADDPFVLREVDSGKYNSARQQVHPVGMVGSTSAAAATTKPTSSFTPTSTITATPQSTTATISHRSNNSNSIRNSSSTSDQPPRRPTATNAKNARLMQAVGNPEQLLLRQLALLQVPLFFFPPLHYVACASDTPTANARCDAAISGEGYKIEAARSLRAARFFAYLSVVAQAGRWSGAANGPTTTTTAQVLAQLDEQSVPPLASEACREGFAPFFAGGQLRPSAAAAPSSTTTTATQAARFVPFPMPREAMVWPSDGVADVPVPALLPAIAARRSKRSKKAPREEDQPQQMILTMTMDYLRERATREY